MKKTVRNSEFRVANLWTLTRSTGPARLAFKRKERNKKFVFSSFEKPAPGDERCCMESPLTFFIFIFKMGEIK